MPARPYPLSLRSANQPNRWLRHRDFLGEVTPVDANDATDRADATFVVVPGLANADLLTLMARNDSLSGHYLRHQDFRLKLQKRPSGGADQELFDADATWIWEPPCRLRSLNQPGRYIRHRNFELWLDQDEVDEPPRFNPSPEVKLFRADSTWVIGEPFEPYWG